MRVIAGKAKGHGLKFLKNSGIRPTSDLLRGAIFSMLESVATDWSRVLDLYAGTGALGIEALSRGAGRADFVEKKQRFCALIKENLERTGFSTQATVYCISAGKAFSVLEGEYGILFMDPPYNDPSVADMTERVANSSLLGRESTLVVEHSKRTPLRDEYGNFHQIKTLHHGDSYVAVYQFTEGAS
jgi:16S rRNA (guanine966-N2)-methyltransferase